MGLKKAQQMVQNLLDSTVRAHSNVFTLIDDNSIKVCSMTITLTPCLNGSVMVTDDRFSNEIVGIEFHSNINTLVFDVIRRAKMLMSIEEARSFELCCNDSSGVSVKCINRELIIN